MTENEIRDLLFDKHKSDLHSLIVETRQPVALPPDSFPSIAQLLQHRTEAKINRMIENLEALQLDGKEVRLVRDSDSTTRIDLLGSIAGSGDLVIIELKKSDQTERQAFTELLGYANHFCTLFPPISESSLQSILIAPMEGRGVRDALAQELIINDKNVLAFIPKIDGEKITLEAYYPSDLYYRWIENNVLDDSSMTVVTASFPLIDGWIDTGEPGGAPPRYTQEAFKTMTSLIAQRLEAAGLHGFVYARQYWAEACPAFPYPNTLVLCVVNPFNPLRASSSDGTVFGASDQSRLDAVQAIVDQVPDNEYWLENLHLAFLGQAIRIMQDAFQEFFISRNGVAVRPEISTPNWWGFKTSMIEAVICHNMHIRLTGLLRTIFTDYMEHCYRTGMDEIYFSDDLPKFGYIAHDHFLAAWEILSGLSRTDDEAEE
ncbi:hypothetical protein [Hoeflea sp.]|uniref:hypothetical protein n=1 Tax=Hoeflea sp. TaxID=1940281 RepID=UPI0019A693DB|nr:hypothetical protein [Hoeflea sp.]MBC7285183.1 hypothetical protein [Hoeflea sp.]